MDVMQRVALPDNANSMAWQRTLKSSIGCVGTGLHSGKRVNLRMHPAAVGHGIVFRRTDLGRDIPASFDRVVDTRLCTVLGDVSWSSARIGTVEHIMAALTGVGVTNALIEVDGPEIPILDGSAKEFVFLLDCAGLLDQAAPRRIIEIRRPVRVGDADAYAELRPLTRRPMPTLDMAMTIDFTASAIGRQSASFTLNTANFRHELASARTFALMEDVEQMRAAGLAMGGSLENAIVVNKEKIVNPGGLRMDAEFARHKLVDAVGDLALAGAALHGEFLAYRSGHALNNLLLRTLFADISAWREVAGEQVAAAA
jgi:UDP-3-O-[3-hydroxymyristoyl] N-acetylglucosamine deacetylase